MSKGNKEEQKWLLGESLNQYDRSLKEELNKVEKRNREQNHKISALINAFDDDYIKKEEENTNISLDYSKEGIVIVDDIKGNTLVNNVKDSNKELVLNGDIDTQGINNITITEGVDGGKVDIALEGNTMVNVCDQEDSIAITKSYEVTTGNHIALQGEYDGKCRPNIYGNTLVNLVKTIDHLDTSTAYYNRYDIHLSYAKENCDYTVIFNADFEANNTTEMGWLSNNTWADKLPNNTVIKGFNKLKLTNTTGSNLLRIKLTDTNKLTVSNLIILEGDYTNKPIPEYFTGMQSSFEDKLITDEKDAHNGKYKVDYKVTGKNLLDESKGVMNSSMGSKTICIKVRPNTSYTYSSSVYKGGIAIYELASIVDNDTDVSNLQNVTIKNFGLTDGQSFTTGSSTNYIFMNYDGESKVQIEEGDTATTYEPYKEYNKTFYLNSPLLEGDTIEDINGKATHVHRYGKVVLDGSNDEKWIDNASEGDTINGHSIYASVNIYSNGECMCDKLPVYNSSKEVENLTDFVVLYNNGVVVVNVKGATTIKEVKSWLQSNPITLISKLKTPTYETISNDSILCDSYVKGHLHVDSVVPIDKVVFQSNFNKSLRYLYPNTEYTIQFESDNIGKIDKIHLGGINSDIVNVTKGINKYILTTGELSSKSIIISGIGFNASKIVVTPKVDGDFGYFKGMKSVGQNDIDGHKIEILSSNGNLCERLEDTHYKVYGGTVSIIEESKNSVIYTTSDWDSGFSYLIGTNGLFKNKRYCISWEKPTNSKGIGVLHDEGLKLLDSNKKRKAIIPFVKTTLSAYEFELPNAFEHGDIIELRFKNGVIDNTNGVCNIRINEGNTIESYVEGKLNKKEILMNEPLRGLPDGVRDKYVLIDGKWYIERNTTKIILDGVNILCAGTKNTNLVNTLRCSFDIQGYKCATVGFGICDSMPYIQHNNDDKEHIRLDGTIPLANIVTWIKTSKLSGSSITDVDKYLQQNPIKVICQLAQPTYEPIDYNPFEVYTDITHISNNSIIPASMVIKNSGYNCILKPNTKYTVVTNVQNSISAKIGGTKVDSTNNVFTIITPSTLTDSVLRFSGKGLTTKNIMLLEGDKTNYIPGYFTGMESAFEQELVTDEKDKNYGKYKVNVKVTDGNKENNITFYINEPLRGVGDVKDKVYVKEDKVVVERNIRQALLTGADNEIWVVHNDSDKSTIEFRYNTGSPFIITDSDLTISDKLIGKSGGNIDRIAWSNDTVYITISRNKLTTVDVAGFRQWLSNNNVQVQNQLATPTYEEIECDLSKLMLENYENSSLILNSNIPPTVDVRYKGELPIVSATKELSSNVEATTTDINQNIIPYMCDMDYRIVELQLKNASTQGLEVNVLGLDSEDVLFNNRKANKIFNPSYEMLKRDILSKRYSSDEYKYRLERYLLADKISNEEYNELEELINGR